MTVTRVDMEEEATSRVQAAMVTLAREARGRTQTSLSEETGISQGYLSKIESGLNEPTSEMLDAISEALRFPRSFFFSREPIFGPGIGEFYHRKRQSAPVRSLRAVHAQVNIILVHIQRLLRSVEIDDRIPLLDVEEMGSPEEVARAIRATWNVPAGPLHDLTRLIEDAGGFVVLCHFGTSKIDALCRTVPGMPPVFFVNDRIPADRYRWSLAHELAHVVMHRLPSPEMEDEANRFAAALLMPARDIKSHLDSRLNLRRLASLKPYWKTSMAALLKRASDLDRITKRKARYLWMQMGKAGYRRAEPAELSFEREQPKLLREILDFHLDDCGYTTEELARFLSVREHEMLSMYSLESQGEPSRPRLRLV